MAKLILRVCLMLLALNLAFLGSVVAGEKIIAQVNDDIITQKDLDDFVAFMRLQIGSEIKGEALERKIASMKKDLLERLIEDKLILQEAKKSDIKIDPNRIKAKINDMKKRYSSESDFQAALQQQGLVQADLEQKAKEQMMMVALIESKVREKIVISPTEVTDFYQKNPDMFKSEQTWEFQNMVMEDLGKSTLLSDALKKGQRLEDLAMGDQLRINKISVQKGQLKKELEDELLALKTGEISRPIPVDGKYYVFMLEQIIPPKKLGLSEAQNSVYGYLYNQKMQAQMAKWLDELKAKSYIQIKNS